MGFMPSLAHLYVNLLARFIACAYKLWNRQWVHIFREGMPHALLRKHIGAGSEDSQAPF